ncbi:hypothetical protein [Streptomyces sp. NPDC048638]|uniref:hypothetical protein n=1 Tax=Streptomyces sp. NPDC048638 TaxID=3365580 RepID=UPI0037166450
MTASLALISDYATRVVEYAITPAPGASVAHLPRRIVPLAVTGFRLTYISRRGSPWTLQLVTCLGNHAADGQTAGARRGQADHYPGHASTGRPAWLNELMATAADPDAPLPRTLAGFTRTEDGAHRFIACEVSGDAEIPQWHPLNGTTPDPLRPDRVRFTFRAEHGVWRLGAVHFQGPWVATGQQPGPDRKRGAKPYYPTSGGGSLRRAPSWVLDLVARHALPPELAAP